MLDNVSSQANRTAKIQKKVLILSPVLALSIISGAIFVIYQVAKKDHAISKMIISQLEELFILKPNNPIIRFLLENKELIIGNIEKSYIADKISIWFIVAVSSLTLAAIGWAFGVYHYDKLKNNSCSRETIKKYKKENALAFLAIFFGTFTIIGISFLIPFLMIMPDKLSTLLCKGIDGIEHSNNGLIEVFKEIIKSTFKEEHLAIDIRESVSKYLFIVTGVSCGILAILVVLAVVYYTRTRNGEVEATKAPDEYPQGNASTAVQTDGKPPKSSQSEPQLT